MVGSLRFVAGFGIFWLWFLLFETLLLYDGYCVCCLDESLAGFLVA